MGSKPTYEELEQKVWKLEEEATEYKQTAQALRRERDKVQKYLDVAGAIIVVIGANQKVSLINRRGCEVLGYEANEIQGKNWFDNFLPERIKEDLRSGFIELMAAPQKDIKEIFEDGGENSILTKGGKERIIAWRNTVLKDEEGNITATMSSGKDVTEARRAEKALQESENKYRTLLENIPQKIFHKDRHSVYVSCNENYARDLMIKPEEIAGKTDYEFFPKELAKKYRADDKRIITSGKTENIEEKYIQAGQEIWVQTAKTPVKDEKGNVTGILGIFWDITQRKRAEEALEQAYDELEQQVEARTKELAKANEKLKEEIYERKRAEEALFNSHEKLRSLASKLSLAEERQRRQVAIEVHDRISQNLAFVKMKLGALQASTSSSSLAGTMDEILKLVDETIQNTRALISELGSPILYELGFVPAVEWLTQQAQHQHGIVVEFENDGQPKPLSEDVRVLLFQAARELLVNIAKHAKPRTAKVSITRDGNQVRVDVEDDGVGFDSAETGSSVDTTGRFGLFSIRMRLEPLGGHMEVDSKPGHGTRVTLVAPLKHNGENKKEKVS